MGTFALATIAVLYLLAGIDKGVEGNVPLSVVFIAYAVSCVGLIGVK